MASPVGAHVRGRAFAAWMPNDALVGASHFGPFDPADLPALRALFELIAHPALRPPYDVVHDLGRVDLLDRPAFQLHAGFLAQWMPRITGRVRRLAVIRPAGLPGAAYTGLFHDHAAQLEGKLFESRDAAFEWLAIDAATRSELESIDRAFEQAPVVRRLRELLAADPREMTLERAAAALGHSTRSLQRHLADEQSSFRDELAHARIHAAKQRLVETDDKIEVIARELGFRSVPAFTTMFGRVIGEAPQAYRDRHR